MDRTEATAFPPPIAELLRLMPLAPLGPGSPEKAAEEKLEALGREGLGAAVDRDMADCCRAGLWLAFGFLDRSHEISQEIHTTEGSYWHGIMHRREPDASNSKYWMRRVGDHAVVRRLRERAAEVGYEYADPFAFIDFVERVRGAGSADEEIARRVQRLEWELLFAHCWARIF
jgi:hypothetical protein